MQTGIDTVDNPNNLRPGASEGFIPVEIITDRNDTIPENDTTAVVEEQSFLPLSPDAPEAPIIYSAEDSIIYDILNNKIYLFGNAKMEHKNISLEADFIIYDWSINELTAEAKKDSLDNYIDFAKFSEAGNEYQARKIRYNFTSTRGKVYEARTQEGEGFIHGREVKKTTEDVWYGADAKYTTCNLDEPHFHIAVNRYKLIPEKVMVSGPANLVIADIPTPLYIPFGIFPVQDGRTSGIILPEYGETASQGFFLRNGGYYFALSDYFDLALRGDIYSRGSWGLRATSNYRLRYKFSGTFNTQFARTRLGDPILPESQVLNDFKVNWTHQQDQKARPNSNFSANVNFGTATYDQNYSVAPQQVLNNSFQSNISFRQSFPGRPFSFNANIRHDQSLTTNRVNLELPTLSFNVNRINPFQREGSGADRSWYENIGFSVNSDFKNVISGIDSTFFTQETFDNAQFGARFGVPISTSFNLFNYLNIEPSIQYNQRMYFETIEKTWDPTMVIIGEEAPLDTLDGRVITDTIPGIRAPADFSFSLSANTRLYGMFNFGDGNIKAIRHIFSPTLSFEYRPDFADPFWGYYREVQKNQEGDTELYSVFQSSSNLYGLPQQGEVAGLRLNLNNNIEMKVAAPRDTTRSDRNIKILERFNISTFYNFARDSVHLSPINMSAYTTLFERINLNASANFDPYIADPENINNRLDRFEWEENKRLARLTNANIGISSNFSADRMGSRQTDAGTEEERQMVYRNPELYADYNIPWSFGFGYNLNLTKGTTANPDSLLLTQSLTFNMDINVTPNWKLMVNSGYDFVNNELTYTTINITRDLHCWEMRITWVPYPAERQLYSIDINVKSAVLQDLKLSRRRDRFDAVF
ncbi:MAG: LPS-assembly protein LptD [Chitinophagaceae bacterium]|nr:MAG: LPS-assembly protein LptD [Chitinophagaceae bacterium]